MLKFMSCSAIIQKIEGEPEVEVIVFNFHVSCVSFLKDRRETVKYVFEREEGSPMSV